jgi:glyoxylase-like metal-dependent hydrolase (beta-lactamase superfamily II)
MWTAPNPGPKTLSGTHTFVIGHDRTYILDPGPHAPDYQRFLAGWMTETGRHVEAVLLSHTHPDHAPGARGMAELLGVPIWGSHAIQSAVADELRVERRFGDGDSFSTDLDLLRVVATPGHTADSVAFWLENARILFSADTILGEGSTLIAPPEGDMVLYLASLQRIRDLRPLLIAPGHGSIIREPDAKIDEYVTHRRERERQVLDALGLGPADVEEIVRRVYSDIDPRLHALAAGSVLAQLAKLENEGRVVRAGGMYSLAQ